MIDPVLEDLEERVSGGPRLTAKEWRSYSRNRRRWNRRAVVSTAAVVLAEVAVAVAWAAWADAISAPVPKL